MDKKTTKILTYLEPHGFTEGANISNLLNDLFPFPAKDTPENQYNHQRSRLMSLLEGLLNANYIHYDRMQLNLMGDFRNLSTQDKWFGIYAFVAYITLDGQKYLEEQKFNNRQHSLDKSILNTNNAVRLSLRIQIILGVISTLAIALTTVYAILAYRKDDPKSLKNRSRELQRQDSILENIQQSQKGIDTSLKIMAKKTSPKKN